MANCSLPDDQLALWPSTAVLETANALWGDKSLDDTLHASLNQPTQSLPKFTWCWFLQRFQSRPVAAAQLYLYTVGLIEHKKSHPRVEVMAALLGLSGVKMYLSRLADCVFSVVGALIPLPTLAGVLATTLVKPAMYDLTVIEGALAEVFVTADRVGSARVQLQLEVILRLVVHIWLHQATQDMDGMVAALQHEDSPEALDVHEFKAAVSLVSSVAL
ncbi:hypothetical protein DYB32_010465 [Aphanomyces invadans]|uniref:Uncharacterized protein n=1 Tax=Aphanomyces invadans TaxID=157072 RepID=A0A3R6Y004_9STRA|nr:hypothetical protein DYB32_010465 [Aphanomyces invadans]